MIDKKTMYGIIELLIKRRVRLKKKNVSALDLILDLDWVQIHIGQYLDDYMEMKQLIVDD